MPTFPEQRLNASAVYKKLRVNKYCLLYAPMQSGKTGTYLCVAKSMLLKGHVKQVIIFSGNRENDLKFQTISRAGDLATVVWGPALISFNPPEGKTLYIWDESHYCQSIGQSVEVFLTNCGLSPGTSKQNGNYLLSVSATPFSELHNIEPTFIVHAHVPSSYWSVKDMIKSRQVKFYSSFNESLLTLKSGFALIRSQNSHSVPYDDIVCAFAKEHNIRVIRFDMHFSGDIEHILSQFPPSPTFILIKKRLQMGKTIINQQHIRFCLETSSHKHTDSLLQGFIGRFSGFNTNHSTLIHAHISSSYDVSRFCDNLIPLKAANLRASSLTTHNEVWYV
jgi:hypothetical protein